MIKELDEAFEVEVVEPESVDGRLPALKHDVNDVDKNVDDDYAATRANLHSIMEQGAEALQKAFRVAIDSEHPTAFESATMLAKALADINAQLLELSEKRVKLKKATNPTGIGENGGGTTNNTFYVGTATDLQKALAAIKSQGE